MLKTANTSPRHMLLFPLALVFYEVALYFSNDVFLPAIPTMMLDLSLSIKEAQLTISLWFMGAAFTTLFAGLLSDHYGRRPLILISAILYTCVSFILIFTTNKYLFLSLRFLQGSMVAFLTVPGYAAIHESFSHKEAIGILAIMSSITVTAPALGPLLGGIILQLANWQAIFAVLFILGAISIILLLLYSIESLPIDKRQPLALHTAGQSYYRLLKNRHFVLYNLVSVTLFSGFIAWVTLSPLLLITHFAFSSIQFGLIQVLVFASYIVGTKAIKYILDDHNKHTLIMSALLIITCASIIGVHIAWLYPNQFFYFLPFMMAYSFSSGLCYPILGRISIEAADEPMGRRTGLQSTLFMMFASLGTSIAGYLYDGNLLSLVSYIVATSIIATLLYVFHQYLKKSEHATNITNS